MRREIGIDFGIQSHEIRQSRQESHFRGLLRCMTEVSWGSEWCKAWAYFYVQLENHSLRPRFGHEILIRYHAEVLVLIRQSRAH